MITKIAKVTNGVLSLPRELMERWENANVLIVPADDTMVVKRMEKQLKSLSEVAERVSIPAMSDEEVANEIASYRAGV
jgi:hypothetical protein